MKYKACQKYLLSKPEAIEDYPFGPEVAVYKVKAKMFATLAYTQIEIEGKKRKQARMNLKCDPDQALMLREIFTAVLPGYHMNKKHWNTICLDASIPNAELKSMIDHSYSLVINSLKVSEKNELRIKYGAQHFEKS